MHTHPAAAMRVKKHMQGAAPAPAAATQTPQSALLWLAPQASGSSLFSPELHALLSPQKQAQQDEQAAQADSPQGAWQAGGKGGMQGGGRQAARDSKAHSLALPSPHCRRQPGALLPHRAPAGQFRQPAGLA